ncbi:hypothetical protein, partial [Actinomadura darangshiensis]|uniref:hypothetical protein n=1 Tax=Actinomadura darangshiensis TaxID=705336 RepID=UPI001A9F5D21
MIGDWVRCTCGLLGCTAVAGAITIGAAAPSEAADRAEPEPRRSMSPACRHAVSIGDWYTAHKCKEAWQAMYEKSRRRSGRGREYRRWADRYDRKSQEGRKDLSPSPLPLNKPAPRPAVPDPPSSTPPPSPRSKSTAPAEASSS